MYGLNLFQCSVPFILPALMMLVSCLFIKHLQRKVLVPWCLYTFLLFLQSWFHNPIGNENMR